MPHPVKPNISATLFADSIAAIGTSQFWESLVEALQADFPFGSHAVFLYRDGRYDSTPSLNVSPADLHAIENSYYKGTYVLSPWYKLVTDEKYGFWTLPEIAPEGFRSGPYYNQYFKPSGIFDECAWVVAAEDGLTGKFSATRYREEGLFRKREIQFARTVTSLVLPMMERHLTLYHKTGVDDGDRPDARTMLASFGTGVLTQREQQVMTLMIQGHTVKSCARELDISPETVRIHRKNIFRKMNAPSQSALLAEVVEHLTSAH